MVEAIASAGRGLAGCKTVWPEAPHGDMLRPATLPHRYSGRTAVNAHIDVREPKPFSNPDSPLGTTMEGPVLHAGASVVPHTWSPGWNSAQAVNKFQSAIGGAMVSGGGGVMLFGGNSGKAGYFVLPEDHYAAGGFIPIARVFGSEELSALAPVMAARIGQAPLLLNAGEAAARGLSDGDAVTCTIGGTSVERVVVIEPDMAAGVIGVAIGFPGDGALCLPGPGTIVKSLGSVS